jgi:hypothetical protein
MMRQNEAGRIGRIRFDYQPGLFQNQSNDAF